MALRNDRGDRELVAMNDVYNALADLKPDEQVRVIEWIERKLDLRGERTRAGIAGSGPHLVHGTPQASKSAPALTTPTPRLFIAEKKPRSDVDRVACLAYYLSRYRDTSEFKTKDIVALNREAGQQPITNPARAVANATALSQYLTPAGGGKKQIAVRGEALVEALPDSSRVREALEANPLVGRMRKRARRGKARPARK